MSVYCRAQNAIWTVGYFEGKSGVMISLPECGLSSVTSETLYVVIKDSTQSIRLYLLHELSRANSDNSYVKPVLFGTAIGAATGFLGSLFVQGSHVNDNNSPSVRTGVTVLFGMFGAWLGLENAIDSDNIKYSFPASTNPEKREAIQKIIDEEKRQD